MWIKNILLLVFVILTFNVIVHGETDNFNNSIENQSNNNSYISSSNEKQAYGTTQLNDIYLRSLELEREFLAQKQKTYDTFLNIVIIILTVFGIFLTVILALIGFWSYKNIKELKDELNKELEKGISENSQVVIEKAIKSINEMPISDLSIRVNKLENYVEYLKKTNEKGQKKLPEYLEVKEIISREPQDKNIFEDE